MTRAGGNSEGPGDRLVLDARAKNVSGFSGNPTCTATESPIPAGYTSTGTCAATLSVGTCTITNTLSKLTPTVVTDIHDAGHNSVTNQIVPLGSIVHDEATVSGTGPTPTGTVDFTFYTNVNCAGAGVDAGTNIALVSGVAHPSDPQGPLSAGLYSFKAHYNGDTNYNAADSPCEPLDPVGEPSVGGLVEILVPGTSSNDAGMGAALFGLIFIAIAALLPAGVVTIRVARRR